MTSRGTSKSLRSLERSSRREPRSAATARNSLPLIDAMPSFPMPVNGVAQNNVVVWGTTAIKILITGAVTGGPFQLGETLTESVSSATGVLKDADSLSAPTYVIL